MRRRRADPANETREREICNGGGSPANYAWRVGSLLRMSTTEEGPFADFADAVVPSRRSSVCALLRTPYTAMSKLRFLTAAVVKAVTCVRIVRAVGQDHRPLVGTTGEV
jgi:hypothetical protein